MKLLSLIFVFFISLNLSAASNLECSIEEKICTIDDKNLIDGDQVQILTPENQIAAEGEVTKMEGNKRTISITTFYSTTILKTYTIKPIDIESIQEEKAKDSYMASRVFSVPPGKMFDLGLGVDRINVGSGMRAFFISTGYYQKILHGLYWLVRGDFFSGKTSISTITDKEFQLISSDMNSSGISISPGLGYLIYPSEKVSLLFDGGAGGFYISNSLSNKEKKLDVYTSKYKDGFSFHLYARIGLLIRFKMWTLETFASEHIIHKTIATSLGAGASFKI